MPTNRLTVVIAASLVGVGVLALLSWGGLRGSEGQSRLSTSLEYEAALPDFQSLQFPTYVSAMEPSSIFPTASVVTAAAAPRRGIVIAWQPSHQGDTGNAGWREYAICGDIVDRVIDELAEFEHVKAWDTKHGLTGTNNYRPRPRNTVAFDSELKMANAENADVFISIHNDGGAPSGVMAECMPSDGRSKLLCTALVTALADELAMSNRGVREVRLYSLEPGRNDAEYRCLLEIGDNAADRKLLESPAGRQRIAEALAAAIREFDYSMTRPKGSDSSASPRRASRVPLMQ